VRLWGKEGAGHPDRWRPLDGPGVVTAESQASRPLRKTCDQLSGIPLAAHPSLNSVPRALAPIMPARLDKSDTAAPPPPRSPHWPSKAGRSAKYPLA